MARTPKYPVSFFLQRREARVLPSTTLSPRPTIPTKPMVMPFPQQPMSINVSEVTSHVMEYNLRGDRMIRRSIAQHNPKQIVLGGLIVGHNPTSYVTRAYSNDQASWIAAVGIHMTPSEVRQSFLDFVNEIKHDGYSYDLIDLQNKVIYTDVELESFTTEQNAQGSRFGYAFSIAFIAYGSGKYSGNIAGFSEVQRLVKKAELDWVNRFGGAANDFRATVGGIVNSVTAIRSRVSRYIGVVNTAASFGTTVAGGISAVAVQFGGVVASLTSAVTAVGDAASALLYSIENFVPTILNEVNKLVAATERLWDTLKEVYNAPSKYWEATKGLFDTAREQKGSVEQENPADEQVNLGVEAMMLASESDYIIEIMWGVLNLNGSSNGVVVPVGTFLTSEDNVKRLAIFSAGVSPVSREVTQERVLPFTLRMGINLFDLAYLLTGSASNAYAIAAANGFKSPLLNAEGAALHGGTKVLVPTSLLGRATNSALLNTYFNGGDPLLTDLLLEDGDLSFGDDIALVSGERNFEQALINRLTSVKGEQLAWDNYGVIPSNTEVGLASLSADLALQLINEPRVEQVSDLNLVLNGDTADVKLNVKPVAAEAIDLNIPII